MSQPMRQRILNYIRRYRDRHGYAPSMREIGDVVGLASLSSVSYQLGQLEAEGSIRRTPGRSRAISLVGPDDRRQEEVKPIGLVQGGRSAPLPPES